MDPGRGESLFLIESSKCTRCVKSRSLCISESDRENSRNSLSHNAYAFADFYDAIGGDVFDPLHQAAGPVNLDIGPGGLAQPKMKAEVTLPNVSAATADFLRLLVMPRAIMLRVVRVCVVMFRAVVGLNYHARADGVAVGFRSFQFQ